MAHRGRSRRWRAKGYDTATAARIASTVRRLRPDAAGNLVVIAVHQVDVTGRERETDAECLRMYRQAARRRNR